MPAALDAGCWMPGAKLWTGWADLRFPGFDYIEGMSVSARIALLGDYNREVLAHQAIPVALELAATQRGTNIEAEWVHTSTLQDAAAEVGEFDALWVVPASPYANGDAVLEAIRHARVTGMPLLGTCGGFQHLIIEYARNVIGLEGADHAENNPASETLLITPLSCSLVEKSEALRLSQGGILRSAYQSEEAVEGYHCNYGVNSAYAAELFSGNLQPTAWSSEGEVRAVELTGHPFFTGTLFQPERRALRGEAPPLVVAFVEALLASS